MVAVEFFETEKDHDGGEVTSNGSMKEEKYYWRLVHLICADQSANSWAEHSLCMVTILHCPT